MDVEALTAATVEWIFLMSNSETVAVGDLRCFLTVLSDGRLAEKLTYLFRHFADASEARASRRGLSKLLTSLSVLAEHLGERVAFGCSLVEGSVAQCASRFASDDGAVDEEGFADWMALEPQIIVWMPTHYRLLTSRGVSHGVPCKACKIDDIVGLR